MTAEITQATEQATPAKEKFSDMLNKFLDDTPRFEGGVVKGTVLAIENDAALIDVGLKVEGRVPLKEFAAPGQAAEVKVGDEVEVYIERFETARGEASLSRERARREEAWEKLEQAYKDGERVTGVISAGSRAASRSISTGPWRSCPEAKSISGRCATSRPWWVRISRSRSSRWIAAAATSSSPAVPCWKIPVPSNATS